MYICDIPPGILAQARNIARKKANLDHLLHSRATRPPVGYRRRPISAIPIVPRPPPKRDPQHPAFSRLTKLLHFCADAVPVRHIQPRDPLDSPATSPLSSVRIRGGSVPLTSLPGGSTFFNSVQSSSAKGKQKVRAPNQRPVKFVDVHLGKATYGDAVGVDNGYRPYVVSFALAGSRKRRRSQQLRHDGKGWNVER
ncbi:hypothetical protein EDD22DRAFT_216743 [Suillus occidentalis]|nr:hypothetical protein EDD22DRAFT_216743 [Suillus occidentalis]